ncbi:MAG: DEAD/DEAH box helicase family protein, partial [Gammaproteobacteria bacterium]|nr:DEAD/DEAH box helicase family protein [Gammaproteobacteria bacterium]
MDSQSQQFLQIAVPSPLRRRFDYLPPHGSDPDTFIPGQRFLVPFGPRKLVGVLLSVHSHTDIDPNKLKHALSCLDEKSVISAPLIELCCWASRYYHHPVGEVFANAIPSLMRQGEPAESKKHWCWKPTEAGTIVTAASFKKNARRQIEALEILQQHPDGLALPMLKTLGVKAMPLEALAQKGYAEKYLRNTTPATLNSQTLFKESPLLLNEYQQPAVHAVIKALDHEPPETKPTSSLPTTFLLNGVTGSGKTEVFLHLAAHCLQQNKQVLILVPEIGLTSQTISRFQSR